MSDNETKLRCGIHRFARPVDRLIDTRGRLICVTRRCGQTYPEEMISDEKWPAQIDRVEEGFVTACTSTTRGYFWTQEVDLEKMKERLAEDEAVLALIDDNAPSQP